MLIIAVLEWQPADHQEICWFSTRGVSQKIHHYVRLHNPIKAVHFGFETQMKHQ